MAKFFVWIESHAGPMPQVWHDMQQTGEGKQKKFLACHVIADDDKRSIEELKKDFAYEAKS